MQQTHGSFISNSKFKSSKELWLLEFIYMYFPGYEEVFFDWLFSGDFLMLLGSGSGSLKNGNPIHRRRRSLSQSQLLDLGGKGHLHLNHLHHLNHQGLFGKVPTNMGLFDNSIGSSQVLRQAKIFLFKFIWTISEAICYFTPLRSA